MTHVIHDNYNIIKVSAYSIFKLLGAFPNTKDDTDGALLQLIKSNLKEVRLTLDPFIYIKLETIDSLGYEQEYIISMDDGMPSSKAKELASKFDELKIKYTLN